MHNSLACFQPELAHWFLQRYGDPTRIQALAWPHIAARENLLVTAPTGTGKTLTAFLWAVNQFVTGQLATGTTRVLYISPLKALNNDIQRNLLTPLRELDAHFNRHGQTFPAIRVLTRSGDTEPAERRRMLRHPPEILITTPESLNLLLSSRGGQGMLTSLDTVILDEVHDVVPNKRGVYLMSAVERLVPLSGEFQRIALSATVNPLETVSAYVAGYRRNADTAGAAWIPRPMATVAAVDAKQYQVSVVWPESAARRPVEEKVWDSLAECFVQHIRRNRSTLLFVNSRALCEKITWKINEAAGETLAWSHHGSLSKELRFEVEQKLKAGELAAIVATGTLEMGIDVGSLDEVILVQSPDAISTAVQRIGRAGHAVGDISKATIYPTHPMDFIEAAVLARAIEARDIEPMASVDCPLDVLAQIIVSMTSVESWDLDRLYDELLRSTPYHRLSRGQFDLVVNMLVGRYGDNHIRELKPRVSIDRLENRISARPGARLSLYLSGGVIPDRGYYQLRHEDSNARLGELDEEFVWEAQVGKVFSFGTQNWQVKKITHNDVIVAPGRRSGVAPPFWKSESISRDFHFASRIGEFLEEADELMAADDFESHLMHQYHLDAVCASELHGLLERQRAHCHASLPHRHHLLVETVNTAPGGASGQQLVLHTGWGARLNRPLAMALEAAWRDASCEQPEIYVSNQHLIIQLRDDIDFEQLLALVPPERIESLLRRRLEGSGFFAARFRENAGRALLLSKGRFNERKPLWMSRLQSQKLLAAVQRYDDFPILLETWRTCLRDEFDLGHLSQMLGEVHKGEIRVTEVRSQTPSPFARSAAWEQINTYMYMSDAASAVADSHLKPSLLEEVVFSPQLRPRVPRAIIDDFEARRQRLATGYAPDGDVELTEWLKERTAVPLAEWPWETTGARQSHIRIGAAHLLVATEDRHPLLEAWTGNNDNAAQSHLANWLQYYGPLTTAAIEARLGIPASRLDPLLTDLTEEQTLVFGQLVENSAQDYWCDAGNYETLLRFMRQAARKACEPLTIDALPHFFRTWQTRHARDDPKERLLDVIERFRCLPLPASYWETELLPSRLPEYEPDRLDLLLQQDDLLWLGSGENRIAFCFADELDLMARPASPAAAVDPLSLAAGGRFDFGTLVDSSHLPARALNGLLWHAVWQGQVTNDSMAALRKGIETGFRLPELTGAANARRRGARRGSLARLRGSFGVAGNWYRLDWPADNADLVQREELNKDRVRLLLDRYGVLFRELLQRELPEFSWRNLFRSIRLMELSGELVSGYFFNGIPGPQFASAEAWRLLQRMLPDHDIFWINAADPASLCGLGLNAIKGRLPRRLAGNHLVYHGARLVLVSERNGRILRIDAAPDDAHLATYFGVLRHLLYRKVQPLRKVELESINGQPATSSPYLDALDTAFDLVRDHKSVYIQREI